MRTKEEQCTTRCRDGSRCLNTVQKDMLCWLHGRKLDLLKQDTIKKI